MDDEEENNLKNDFRRIFETLKEEMRYSLKEMEEKANKKWKTSANHLKKTEKKQSNM